MRILTGHYGRHRGGSERALERLVAAWRDLGHDVRCPVEQSASPLKLAAQLRRDAKSFVPDFLFAGGQTYALPLALARRRGAVGKLPFAMKLSNAPLDPGHPLATRASQLWLKAQGAWTDCFVAPDGASAALLADIGIVPGKIATVANPAADAVHLERLHKAGGGSADTPNASLHLLTVGRLAPQKNVSLLIEAFCRIARPDDRLTIVGDGPLRERLEAQAARHQGDVRFFGHHPDPAPAFAQANAFALASNYEGLPAVLVEALAAGLPIAATNSAPGIADLIAGFGTLAPVQEAASLARALESLRHARPDRAAMLERAMQFTAQRAAPLYIDVFKRLTLY